MKKIEVNQATNSLGQYVRELEEEPLVLIQDGHPIAALLPIDDADLEIMTLRSSPRFQELIEHSRQEHRNGASVSAAQVRGELGIE